MALNTVNTILATIQTRHGIELDFDADQMTVGEWSLSTDKKIVRICIMPGLCIRMATYEAFEEDMAEVQRILTECQDIHVAVNEIADLVEQHKDAALESASIAKESEKAAKISEEKSRTSEINSKASEAAARSYKDTAMEEAEKSRNFSENAEISAQISSQKSLEASASALAAKESETEAKKSEEGAFASKADSEDFSLLSESWAKGETGVRIGEDTNNSRYFSDLANVLVSEAQKLLDQAQKIVSAATNGALIPAGTVSFADLPESPMVGYLYNISDDFTTDSRFAEGSGIYYRAGANVYWTSDEKWDVMIGTQVTGVKGENEDTYHVGNVNITKSSLGLGNVGDYKSVSVEPQNLTSSEKKNGRDNIGAIAMDGNSSDTTVEFEQSNDRTELLSGETISSLFGKTKKWISDLPGAKVIGFIETLTDFNQIDSSFRYWRINTIDDDYAQETGIERNVGDFYVLILSCNGNSEFAFKFGNCILSSPRLDNDYYLVQLWNGSPRVTYHRANVPALTNSLLATAPGTALDAVQGNVLGKDLYDQMNFFFIFNPQSKNEVAEKIFEIFNSNIKLHSINFGIFKDKTGGLDIPNGKYFGKIVYNGGDVSGILLSAQSEKNRLNISGYIFGTPRSVNIEYFRDDPDLQLKIDKLNSDLNNYFKSQDFAFEQTISAGTVGEFIHQHSETLTIPNGYKVFGTEIVYASNSALSNVLHFVWGVTNLAVNIYRANSNGGTVKFTIRVIYKKQ